MFVCVSKVARWMCLQDRRPTSLFIQWTFHAGKKISRECWNTRKRMNSNWLKTSYLVRHTVKNNTSIKLFNWFDSNLPNSWFHSNKTLLIQFFKKTDCDSVLCICAFCQSWSLVELQWIWYQVCRHTSSSCVCVMPTTLMMTRKSDHYSPLSSTASRRSSRSQ